MSTELQPYAAITGTLPSRRELSEWNTRKFLLFLDFCELFMIRDGDDYKITITEDRLKHAERFLAVPHHAFQEFLWRVNQFSTDVNSTPRKFFYKHAAFMRQVLGYLKLNPAAITDEMRAIIEPNPRYNWCLKHTKVQTLRSGAEVVTADTLDNVSYQKQQVQAPNAEKMLVDAIIETTNLYSLIAKSVKKKDIEELKPMEKINALQKLSFVLSTAQKWKPTALVFKQLNVHSAGKDDLEKALLSFGAEEQLQ